MVIIIAIVAVLAIGGGAYYLGKSSTIAPLENFETSDYEQADLNENTNTSAQNSTTSNLTQTEVWLKSPKFGLYYPSGFEVSEFYYLNPVQTEQGVPESQGLPEFRATNGNAIISWGGAQSGCEPMEYGSFQSGVSTVTCLKGMRAQVGLENARGKLSNEEIKIFGDFVLKNQ